MRSLFLLLVAACGYTLSAQVSTPWYTIKEVTPKVWVISDHGADNIFLDKEDVLGGCSIHEGIETLNARAEMGVCGSLN